MYDCHKSSVNETGTSVRNYIPTNEISYNCFQMTDYMQIFVKDNKKLPSITFLVELLHSSFGVDWNIYKNK